MARERVECKFFALTQIKGTFVGDFARCHGHSWFLFLIIMQSIWWNRFCLIEMICSWCNDYVTQKNLEERVNGTKNCSIIRGTSSFCCHIFLNTMLPPRDTKLLSNKKHERKQNEILKLNLVYKILQLINVCKYPLIKDSSFSSNVMLLVMYHVHE